MVKERWWVILFLFCNKQCWRGWIPICYVIIGSYLDRRNGNVHLRIVERCSRGHAWYLTLSTLNRKRKCMMYIICSYKDEALTASLQVATQNLLTWKCDRFRRFKVKGGSHYILVFISCANTRMTTITIEVCEFGELCNNIISKACGLLKNWSDPSYRQMLFEMVVLLIWTLCA